MSGSVCVCCVVCGAECPKYRCPGCWARYCGVACFGAHRAACAPVSRASESAALVPGVARASRKRPYQSEREELSFSATSEALQRVRETDEARAVLAVLATRMQKHKKKTTDQKLMPDHEEEGGPEVISTKRSSTNDHDKQQHTFASAVTADAVARMNRMADIVVKVCNAPTLVQKREMLLNFCANDPDCDAFCNVILEAVGARKDGKKEKKKKNDRRNKNRIVD